MNKSIHEAQQELYNAITLTVSRKGQRILANAAFYLGDHLWPEKA